MMYKCLVLVVAFLATASADMPGLLCDTTDSVILIDSSQSITPEQFENIKQYTINFVNHFTIGHGTGEAQFAVVIFNEGAAFQWPLNKYSKKDDLVSAIKQLPYMTGITDTGKAFETAQKILQDTAGGSRRGSCNGIVLFTDGRHDHGNNPVSLASQIRTELQATVISVAVEGINGFLAPFDKQILIDIAGEKDHFFELKQLLPANDQV